jgi:branched-subunit amino acid transport protein
MPRAGSRPLSSLLLALDQRLFGNDPLPAHVHSLLWFVVASIVAAAIFRSVLSRTSATIATAIYALASAHMITTAWVASRHALVSAALGAIAV